jgi:S1-C subfamily serine protease
MRTRIGQVMFFCMVLLLAIVLASCSSGNTATTTGGSTATTAGSSATTTASEAHSDVTEDEASPAQQVLNAVYSSVVNIDVKVTLGGQTGEGIGSGVVYTADGYILTNAHVVTLDGAVSSGQTITVTFSSGDTVPATVVGVDATRDIAAIKVANTGLHPVNFAAANDVQLAEWAIVIGSPLDFRNSVTLGIISGLDRTFDLGSGQAPLTGLIQIDAPISPGNSGGGCFDINGHFVGMPEVYLPPGSTGAENIGFAIPADVVASVAKTLTGK